MIGFTSISFLANMDLSHRDVQYFLLSELIHPAAFVRVTRGEEKRVNALTPPEDILKKFKNSGKFEDFVYEYANYLVNTGKIGTLACIIKSHIECCKDILFFTTDEELPFGYLELLSEVIRRRYGICVLNPYELLKFYSHPTNITAYRLTKLGEEFLMNDLNYKNQQIRQTVQVKQNK